MSKPWDVNPYSGRRHVLDWFMWRIAERFPGRPIRLPFGRSTWTVTETGSDFVRSAEGAESDARTQT